MCLRDREVTLVLRNTPFSVSKKDTKWVWVQAKGVWPSERWPFVPRTWSGTMSWPFPTACRAQDTGHTRHACLSTGPMLRHSSDHSRYLLPSFAFLLIHLSVVFFEMVMATLSVISGVRPQVIQHTFTASIIEVFGHTDVTWQIHII